MQTAYRLLHVIDTHGHFFSHQFFQSFLYSRGRYMPYPMDLQLVFQRTLEAAGSERIIFGTDSSHFPRGFRRELLEEQLGVLKPLGVPKEDARLVMGGNIARLLGVKLVRRNLKPRSAMVHFVPMVAFCLVHAYVCSL